MKHVSSGALYRVGTVVVTLVTLVALAGPASAATSLATTHLRCEYRENPLGVDELPPRLSWRVVSDQRGARQTAYQVLVSSDERLLAKDRGDLWDSGKVASDETIHRSYAGKDLQSRMRCHWKVRVWDGEDQPSDWSAAAFWQMGLLDEDDWSARYISYRDEAPIHKDRETLFLPAARQYRKPFSVSRDRTVRRATVYATALGIYELHLNGKQVGDALFEPGWTDYRQRAYYVVHDVTDALRAGENAVGAWVADGWYSGYLGFGLLTSMGTEKIGRYTYGKTPSFMAQLEIEFTDGTRQTVVTDKTWKVTANGPIREADFLMGEFYDARLENPGWADQGFVDSSWDTAIFAGDNGNPRAMFYEGRDELGGQVSGKEMNLGFSRPRLEAFPGEMVRITEQIRPVEVTKRAEGTHVFNLGQNFAGNIRFRVKGPAGHKIRLRYAEMLHPDGSLMTENLRRARAIDHYVCRGDGEEEVYQPRFTFHGFQYVEVSNFPGEPTFDTITGLVLNSDTPMASSFECSDPVINRLFQNVLWTQRANFIDLPTDCPQRDERMGWTGDAQVYVGTATYNADVGAFYTKWVRELMESQRPSGAFPGYAPFPFQHGKSFGIAWSDAGIICPWTIWQAYGDTRIVERCWPEMSRFMDWRKKTSVGDLGVSHGNQWGDWLTQGASTPLDYIDSVYYAITSRMMAEMASAIGKQGEAARHREQLGRTVSAFNAKYVRDDASLTVDTQTAYALALYAGLIPVDRRENCGGHLARMIQDNGYHMTTGFLGTRPLLPVLTATGNHDLATFMLQSREFPSWGYEVEQGATTIWERWDSYTKEDAFGRHNAAMNSFSHYAFGAVCEWMFRSLAGIESDGVGYKKITIRPGPPSRGSNADQKPIHQVSAHHDSIRGRIVSEWKVLDSDFHLEVTIPANTTATVYLPAAGRDDVRVDEKALGEIDGVKFVRMQGGRAVVEIVSGTYSFLSRGAIAIASTAFKCFTPADRTLNPESIDLTDAKRLFHWDFRKTNDVTAWNDHHNLKVETKGDEVTLVSTGDDPQMATRLSRAVSGSLVVVVRARPTKRDPCEWFWSGDDEGFRGGASSARPIQEAGEFGDYVFRIGGGKPVQRLRFDPIPGLGSLPIESISILELGK